MATHENTSFRDPIDWNGVRNIVLGVTTFENVLYDPDTLQTRAPAYYRTGKTRDGDDPRFNSGSFSTRFWDAADVADFMNNANNGKTPENTDGTRHDPEEVAVTPTQDELNQWKDEYDTGTRQYEPHYVRVPFFDERVVGDHGTAGAYKLVISEARYADNPRWDYSWEADYETGDVIIETWEV